VTTVLHWLIYAVIALLGWLGLVLTVGTVIHGTTRVWARTKETSVELVWRRRHRRSTLPQAIPPQRDQPIALMPRGGWL
jgi:hypothetical protein